MWCEEEARGQEKHIKAEADRDEAVLQDILFYLSIKPVIPLDQMNLGNIEWHIWALFNRRAAVLKGRDHSARFQYTSWSGQCPGRIVSPTDFSLSWILHTHRHSGSPLRASLLCISLKDHRDKMSPQTLLDSVQSNQLFSFDRSCSRQQFDTWVIGVTVKVIILQGKNAGDEIRRRRRSTHMKREPDGHKCKRNSLSMCHLLAIFKEHEVKFSKCQKWIQ